MRFSGERYRSARRGSQTGMVRERAEAREREVFRRRARKAKKAKSPPVPMPGVAEGEARDLSAPPSKGLRELVARELDAACRDLARQIVAVFEPELVVGLVKGGVFAGEELAQHLGCDFVAVRLHPRSRDRGLGEAESSMPPEVEGKRVLVVDDIPGTGETLLAAIEAAKDSGALEVRTATLIAREGGFRPDFSAVETEDLVVFPWDYEPTPGAVGSLEDESED